MKLPNSFYNTTSFFGSLIAGFTFLLIVFLFVITTFFTQSGNYLGLITFILLPGIFIIGLLMIPLGMILKNKREKKTGIIENKWKVIDLNKTSTRNAMIVFVIGSFIILFASSIGSYKAFHYTESVKFCGQLCHKVMNPEYTAYLQSPHARVKCVECHVGEGADWYVKSKLSGLYQVYSVIFDKYSKPIPTPISNLRPARETCEKCHWPDKFYPNKLVTIRSYITDTVNSECDITLKMKISSGISALGHAEGIHWHINPNVKIEYISKSNHKDTIPWVKYTNLETGKVTVFQDVNEPLAPEEMLHLQTSEMDCMDCHNRPSHSFKSPSDYVDDGINKGIIPKDLKFIKQISMQVLTVRTSTTDSSLNYIKDNITSFYKDKHPDIYKTQKSSIDKAITGIQNEFSKNSFPEMNVYNTSYANHIGHQQTKGCFRCHSGNMAAEDGTIIRNDCNLCHSIVAEKIENKFSYDVPVDSSLEFVHPVDIDKAWKEMSCSECHSALF
ncbi:MAG: cytochrome C [Chlorobi bacterium]|nr:cytochrome C [Chlorobiota bacterium]